MTHVTVQDNGRIEAEPAANRVNQTNARYCACGQ
jgi:hypothetical protein